MPNTRQGHVGPESVRSDSTRAAEFAGPEAGFARAGEKATRSGSGATGRRGRLGRLDRLRRGLAALAVAAVVPVTASCAASFGAATQEPYTPGDGVWADTGDLQLRNLIAVSDLQGRATLVGTIINQGSEADRLVGVSVPRGRSAAQPVALEPGRPAVLGVRTELGEPSQVTLQSPRIQAGRTITLRFEFEDAAPVSAEVMVVRRTGPYATVPPPMSIPSEPPQSS